MSEYPLYPELSEEGKLQAQIIMNKFALEIKEKIREISEKALCDLYCNIVPHIESDSWGNFRNHIMDGFKNYNNRLIQSEWDFKEIRQAIYKEHKAEIDKDLTQDNLEKIKSLEETIRILQEARRY